MRANRIAGNLALALGYFVVARISLLFAYRDLQITAVWLPSGIAMAAVMLYGPKALPGVVLGDLAAGLTFGTAPWVAVLVALGGALEATVGARLLPPPRDVRGQGLFGVPQVLRFVLRGALVAPLASTLVGSAALYLAGTLAPSDLPRAMAVWWTGDCVGILLVLPIVLLTLVRGRPPSLRRHGDIALLALTLGTAALVFFHSGLARTSGNALGFLVFPLIVWCAFDFSASLLAATNLGIAIIALAGTSMGLGPYALANDMSDIWTLQAYVAAIAIMSLMLRGAIEDRRRSGLRADSAETARVQAEASARSKAMMMSYFAHEIGNPINAILGLIYLMQVDRDHPLPPEQAARLARLSEAGEHVTAVMRDILDIQRMEAGRFEMQPQAVDVHSAVRRVLEQSAPAAQAAQVELVLADAPSGRRVVADPTRLQQCLLNLVSNAIKYNRAGGRVTVSSRDAGGRVLIDVRDTGPGLSEEQVARLFEPFNRLGRRRDTAGAGIGLVITRLLMAAMDGSVEVSSRPGEGSCFTLGLPEPNAE